jgi:adenine-specific DNA-methyltransferase
MSQPERFDGASAKITDEQKAKLKSLFPEVVTEGGKIDFDRLKITLGESVDVGKERYGMNWPGKADCFKTIQRPSMATLVPARDESVDFDATENLIIEGDNLETLKLLQKSYLGNVKMIYIDPPYNTGSDFIYPDDYSETLDTYLRYTGQVDEEGRKFSTNAETDGRFHSKWINMMYPRLFLARNLLRDDGVIFVSIGDHELHNLRSIMNDVFGEENYVNTVCVKAKPSAGASGGGEDKRLKKNAEFLLIFTKNRESASALDLNKAFDETELSEHISAMREDGKSWKYTRALVDAGSRVAIGTTTDGDGNEIKLYEHNSYKMLPISDLIPPGKSEADAYLKHFETVFRDTNAQSSIRTRVMDAIGTKDGLFSIDYMPRSGRSKGKVTTVYYKGANKDQLAWLKDIATKNENQIFIRGKTGTLWADFNWNNVSKEGGLAFPNGKKPIAFIQRMLEIATKPDQKHVVLDFFAGSGSTGHATLAANQEDQGNRRFVMIQLPEPSEIEGLKTISNVCEERMRRVAKKMNADVADKLELGPEKKQDVGFRVFKLESSNFRAWNSEQPKDHAELAKQLTLHTDHLVGGRSQEDVLYELLLKSGFPLTTKVEKISLAGKSVFAVADGMMLICLEKELTPQVIKAMADGKPERVVCLDAGFADNDQLKTNAVQTMKSKGVTKFQTV